MASATALVLVPAPPAEPAVSVTDAGQPTVGWRHFRNGLRTVTGAAGQDAWSSAQSLGRESKPVLRAAGCGAQLLTSTPSGEKGVRARIGIP